MRVFALYLFVAFFSLYAFRDWFKSACALVLLIAVIQHPDFPKEAAGVQGANPWNILLVFVFTAWLINRRVEKLRWDMPRGIGLLLAGYALVIVIGFVRRFVDMTNCEEFTRGELISEYFINTFKFAVPGLMIFDGCRNPKRMKMALVATLGVYVLLAVQVVRWMPIQSGLSGADLTERSRKILQNEVGFHAVNLSMMLAGASWALLACLPLVTGRWRKLGLIGMAMGVMFGQALTGGRTGYATWGAIGLIMCMVKWRKQLLLIPVAAVLIAVAVPGAVERMTQGFGRTDASGREYTDDYKVTSGRTTIWPYVIDKIMESPVIGWGRLGMNRTGLVAFLRYQLQESFPHPHNVYLECLLDNGVVGAIPILCFYFVILYMSVRLFRSKDKPWHAAVGGMSMALVLALLIAGVGSQTFYPREGATCMWVAMGLMLRVTVEARRQRPVPMRIPLVIVQPPRHAAPAGLMSTSKVSYEFAGFSDCAMSPCALLHGSVIRPVLNRHRFDV